MLRKCSTRHSRNKIIRVLNYYRERVTNVNELVNFKRKQWKQSQTMRATSPTLPDCHVYAFNHSVLAHQALDKFIQRCHWLVQSHSMDLRNLIPKENVYQWAVGPPAPPQEKTGRLSLKAISIY